MKINTKFLQYYYYINSNITPTDINLAVNMFSLEISDQLTKKQKLCIIFQLKIDKKYLLNISPLYIDYVNNLKDIEEILLFYWNSQLNDIKRLKIEKIVFTYKFIDSDIEYVNSIFMCDKKLLLTDILPENYIDLPNNRLFETWGDDITINGNNTYIVNNADNSIYYIININNEYFVWLKNVDYTIQYFHDTYDPSCQDNNTFIRNINNKILYYNKGNYHIV